MRQSIFMDLNDDLISQLEKNTPVGFKSVEERIDEQNERDEAKSILIKKYEAAYREYQMEHVCPTCFIKWISGNGEQPKKRMRLVESGLESQTKFECRICSHIVPLSS